MNNLFTKNTILFLGLALLLCGAAFFSAFIGHLPGLIALAILGLIALISFVFPKTGLLASVVAIVLFERYFTQQSIIWNDTQIKFYPLDAMLGGVYLSLLARKVTERFQKKTPFSKGDFFLGGFFVVVSLLFLWMAIFASFADISIAFSTWKNYVFYGCMFFAVREVFKKERDRIEFGKVFVATAGIAIVFLLIGIIRGEGLWSEFTPLSTSGVRLLAFPHALYFSLAFLGLFLAASMPKNFFGRWYSLAVFVVPVMLAIGVVGSLMRHLWVALAGAIAAGWIALPSTAKSQSVRNAGAILGVFAVMGVLAISLLTLAPNSDISRNAFGAVSSFAERVVSISNASVDESVAWRGSVWESSLEKFSKNPMFGVGLGQNVPVELGDYRAIIDVRNIHNSWLALLVQTGLIGMILFGGFLISLAMDLVSVKARRPEEYLFRSVFLAVGMLFVIAFLFQPYLESNILATFFWMSAGLASAFVRDSK